MFIPVTMNSAERIVETIQDIKEKIPSDPFEAELILMAEMVAQQNEGNDKEKTHREKRSESKDRERQEAAPPDGTCGKFCTIILTSDSQHFFFLIMKLWSKYIPDKYAKMYFTVYLV